MMRFKSFPERVQNGFSFKRLTILLSLLLIIGVIAGTPARMQEGSPRTGAVNLSVNLDNQPFVQQQVVVQLMPGYDVATVASMYGLNPVPLSQFQTGVPPVTNYLLQITDGMAVADKVAELSADALRVAYVEPNYNAGAPEAARPTWSVGDSYANIMAGRKAVNSQWARNKIRLNEAQQMTRGATASGQPIIVAVLDTGIDLNHPAFAGRLVQGHDFVDNDDNPSEEGSSEIGPYGHGTHVAGLIAMVAPDAKIMPIRVLGADGRGNFWNVALGIKYALDNGATVINLSLSTTSSSECIRRLFYDELDGVDGATLTGAVVVAAAGNSGTSIREYPAAVSANPNQVTRSGRCVLSVAASNVDDELAVFSTRGSWVNLMSPGERIVSSVPFNHYGIWAGTSMAAPIVAGEVALVRAMNPTAEPKDVVAHIKSHSELISGQQQRRIDAASAVMNIIPAHNRMQTQRSGKR
ncbi:MAG: S8 family serine peptidase [Acidobacteria bacterium]|nr:S8 family serine peptidase [Acidobacteriota bacterium]